MSCGVDDSLLVQAGMRYPGVRFYEGLKDELLAKLAQDCANLLAQRGESGYWRDGHPDWDSRFAEIRDKLSMTGVEVSAMARPGEGDKMGRELYYDWERSEGHWRVVSTPHVKYGDGLARDSRGVWYGVIIVAD